MNNKEKLFSFNTPTFPNYNLEVVSFKGYQEIGELFRYEIDLISKESDIDFDKILQSEVSLQIHEKNGEDIFIHGVLEYFEAHQQIDDFIHYKTSLVPKLWWLSLAQHQEIFLDKKVPDIIESVLKAAKFTSSDYEFRLQGSYDKREFVCQYKESRYDFIKRWMYRDGIYFYFESDENSTKLIITDSKNTQKNSSHMQDILYKPVSGLQDYENQAASSIIYRSNNTLQSVRMRNYNYEKPSLDINATTNTPYEAYKETYLFGNNLKSQDEAKKLSEIQAQKYKALDKEIVGESNIRSLSVGNIFTLKEYFKKDLNGEYLMVKVESEGSQRGFFTTAFHDGSDESTNYSNTFTIIPAITQYRMQQTSPWPYISGVISATIDGQGGGDTAELDKYGRYKVIMPFDLSGRGDAKASAYLRMAQPSAGEKQGMHFPLHKGTEVLIGFKGGDPDQPIIMGAVPNINSPSPVNEDNVTKSVIQTHGGNIIHMEDTPGKAHIKLAVHDDLSSITIHNQDDEEDQGENDLSRTDTSLAKKIFGLKFETQGGSSSFVGGNVFETMLGLKESFTAGATSDVMLGAVFELDGAAKASITLGALLNLIRGGQKTVTPDRKRMQESIVNISISDEQVKKMEKKITESCTEVIEKKVIIAEKNITEHVESTVSGMKLIKTLKSQISSLENNTITANEVTKIQESMIEKITTRTEKVNQSFKDLQFESKKVAGILSNAKFRKDGDGMREMAGDIFKSGYKLTMFN